MHLGLARLVGDQDPFNEAGARAPRMPTGSDVAAVAEAAFNEAGARAPRMQNSNFHPLIRV